MFTPKFRINWPQLFTPVPKDADKPERGLEYRVEAVFDFPLDDPRFDEMKQAATKAMLDFFGPQEQWPANWISPFRDHKDKKTDKNGALPVGYKPGNIFITLKCNADKGYVPGIVDANVQEITMAERHKVYSGRWAIADVRPFAYDNRSKGVSFGLNHIQILDDPHEPWDNRTNAKDVFKPVAKSGEGAATAGQPVKNAFG